MMHLIIIITCVMSMISLRSLAWMIRREKRLEFFQAFFLLETIVKVTECAYYFSITIVER